MKIALVTQGYQSAGGVQAVARWIVEEIQSSGHDVHVFNIGASSRDSLSRRLTSPSTWGNGVGVQRDAYELNVTHVGTALAELEPIRYLPTRALSDALSEYDVVQIVAGGPALALAAARSGRPTILQVATRVRWERSSIIPALRFVKRLALVTTTRIVEAMEPAALRAADVVLVENHEMAREVARLGGEQRVVLAPPGVDTGLFIPAPTGWNPDGPIVSVGRLGEPRKAWSRIFRSYATLRAQFSEAPQLIIAGRGRLNASDRAVLADLGLTDDVTVLEDLPQHKIIEVMQSASVFWQASHEEGLGIAAVEAMACGLPVIATSTAGTDMTVADGKTGHLVAQEAADDPQTFAGLTETMLTRRDHAFAQAARDHAVDHFSSEATFAPYLDAYVRLTGRA